MATGTKKKATFDIYRTKHKNKRAGRWSWRLRMNGQVIATAGEAYTRRRAARRSIDRFVLYTQRGRFRINYVDGRPMVK